MVFIDGRERDRKNQRIIIDYTRCIHVVSLKHHKSPGVYSLNKQSQFLSFDLFVRWK